MSLIGYTLKNKVPFIISDLLFSSRDVEKGFKLPTNNFKVDEFLPKSLIYKAHSLGQKVYIIKENVCLALAGIEFEMVKFLENFRLRCSYIENVTERYIRDFIDEYSFETEFANSAFLISVWEQRGESSMHVGMFSYPNNETWGVSITDIYGKVHACGSGKEGFFNIMKQDRKFVSTFPQEERWHALQTNLTLIAKLLALEKVTLYTLANSWGGGFEIVFFNGKSFEKLEKTAYVVSHGQFNLEGNIGLPLPRLIIYPKYFGDVLTITAIEILKARRINLGDSVKIISDKGEYEVNVFIVPTIEKKEVTKNFKETNFSFQTYSLAMGYAINIPSGGTYNPGFFSFQPNLCVVYEQEGTVELTLSTLINNQIREDAKNIFPKL